MSHLPGFSEFQVTKGIHLELVSSDFDNFSISSFLQIIYHVGQEFFNYTFVILEAEFFIGIFTQDGAVIDAGTSCLRLVSYGFLFYALGKVMIQSFNGAGDTTTPTWINLFCFWLLEIPLAWVLSIKAGFEEQGVYLSIVIAESLLAIIAMVMFRRGKWKLKKV